MDSFSNTQQTSRAGLWEWPDITKKEMWWSDSLFDFFGYTAKKITPDIKNFLRNVHPDDKKTWEDAVARSREVEDQLTCELQFKNKDGVYRPFTILMKALSRNKGKIRLSGSIQPMERKPTEKEFIRQTEEMLLKAQNTAMIGFWEYDLRSHEITWSKQSYLNFGLSPDTNITTYDEVVKLIHPDYIDYHNQVTEYMIYSGQCEFEYLIVTPSGEKRGIWGVGELLKNEEGEPIKLFGILQNVTERKKREDQLKDQEFLLDEVGRLAKIGG